MFKRSRLACRKSPGSLIRPPSLRPQIEELEPRALPSCGPVSDTVASPPPSPSPPPTPIVGGSTNSTTTGTGSGPVAHPDIVPVAALGANPNPGGGSVSAPVAHPDVVPIAALGAKPNASGGYVYYTPAQIQQAYGINQLPKLSNGNANNGAGETIAIVDAYNDPNIASDLATFDAQEGLPGTTASAVNSFLKVDPMANGIPTNSSWALETSLDVEWAHAVAPGANIVLVEATSSSIAALTQAVNTAANLPGVVAVSMSWGSGEFSGESSYDSTFTHSGVTYIASSGDSGVVEYPSVSPNVLAVGGTTLNLNSSNNWLSETAWSDSGGGKSRYEAVPSFQKSLGYGVRTTPDVSYNANPNTGFLVYDSVPYDGASGWWDVGGTSAGSPQWTGIVALADQARAAAGKAPLSTSQLESALYSSAFAKFFHDITSGSNGSYSAGPGYDLVTGLGSPIVNTLVPALAGV